MFVGFDKQQQIDVGICPRASEPYKIVFTLGRILSASILILSTICVRLIVSKSFVVQKANINKLSNQAKKNYKWNEILMSVIIYFYTL